VSIDTIQLDALNASTRWVRDDYEIWLENLKERVELGDQEIHGEGVEVSLK
jgi:hypothetical protein